MIHWVPTYQRLTRKTARTRVADASVRRDIAESVYTYAVHGCVDLREVCWQRLSTGAVAKWLELGLFREIREVRPYHLRQSSVDGE